MTAANPMNGFMVYAVRSLLVTGVIALIGLGYAQAQQDTRIKTNTKQHERNQPKVDSVAVVKSQISDMKSDIGEIKTSVKDIANSLRGSP